MEGICIEYNPTIDLSKFVFNNKLLSGVILLRVTSGVILTQLMFKNAIEKLFKKKKKEIEHC